MSISILLELVIAILSGAGVGWITNSIAINMLFKKYGKWGGVIEEKYEEFIEKMSQLVEDDLVNHRTLQGECNSQVFKDLVHTWIEDVLRKELPEKSGFIRLEEIPGIEQSVEQLILLMRKLDPYLVDSIYRVFEHKEIQAVLSKEHYEYLIDRNIGAIFSGDTAYKQDFEAILYRFLSDHAIKTLVSPQAVFQITENIKGIIQKIDFSQFDGDIDSAYTVLLRCIGIDEVIRKIEQSLGKMRFADFIKDPASLSRKFIFRLIGFSASLEGQTLFLEGAKYFLQDTKNIPFKIIDIMSPAVKTGIVSFINEKTPVAVDWIADFISETRTEIDQIINDTVDRHLKSSAEGTFFKFFKDFSVLDAAKQFNAVNTIISGIYKHSSSAGNRIINKILSFIETNTIGDSSAILQKKNVVTPQGVLAMIHLNLKNLSQKNYNYNRIETLLQTKIGSVFQPDLSQIRTAVLPQIIKKIKEAYLYHNTFKNDLQSKLTDKITKLTNKSVAEFLGTRNIPVILKENTVKNHLRRLWNRMSIKKIGPIVPRDVLKNQRINWESLWNNNKHRELNQVYQALQKDEIYTEAMEVILESLNQHLDIVLTGNVSSLVNNELKKSSPAQIRAIVQDFMGKELTPINIFGAFLGAIAGGMSVWIASIMGVPREFTWRLLLGYGAIFAAVGIGTNWLAIKMLFRPYKKIVFNVSPCIGIAAARKPQFAKNISAFVKERTLNDAALTQFFSKNKNSLKEKSDAWVSASGYAIIDTLLRNNQRLDRITGFIASAIQNYSTRHSADIADLIVKMLKELLASGKMDEYLSLFRDGIIQKLREWDAAPYMYALIKEAVEGKQLGRYVKNLSPFAGLLIKNVFETLVKELNIEKATSILYRQNDRFMAYISTHSFEDLAGTCLTAGLVQRISEEAGRFLHAGIGPIITYFQDKELNPDTKLRYLLNGTITKLIEKHSTYILDRIAREISKQKSNVVKYIKDAMPWYAIPAKGQVVPIVDLLIDEELPAFLGRKKDHILSIIDSLLEYRLSDLGFTRDTLNRAVIERILSGMLDSPPIQEKASHCVRIIAEQYARLPLKSILTILNIHTIQDVAAMADPLLRVGIDTIKINIIKDDASDSMANSVQSLISNIADTITLEDLFTEIDLEKELQGLIALILHDKTVMEALSPLLMSILLNIANDKDFYHEELLRKDLERLISGGMEQDWKSLWPACIPLFKKFFQHLNSTITVETKQTLCQEYLVVAVLDAAEYHFNGIIRAIDIQSVVEREVNAMHPREIEKLFYKFAGKYFTKITMYGWIGVFGGILSYIIGCILGLLLK